MYGSQRAAEDNVRCTLSDMVNPILIHNSNSLMICLRRVKAFNIGKRRHFTPTRIGTLKTKQRNKKWKITSIGEGVEKLESSYVSNDNVR